MSAVVSHHAAEPEPRASLEAPDLEVEDCRGAFDGIVERPGLRAASGSQPAHRTLVQVRYRSLRGQQSGQRLTILLWSMSG